MKLLVMHAYLTQIPNPPAPGYSLSASSAIGGSENRYAVRANRGLHWATSEVLQDPEVISAVT